MTTSARPYTFDRVVRLLISVGAVAAAVWFIDMLKDVLLPFLVSCLIAYLLEPFVQYNRSRGAWLPFLSPFSRLPCSLPY